MDAAELRKARYEILAVHVDARPPHRVDLPSIAVFEFDGADLMCERVYYDAGAFAALAGD